MKTATIRNLRHNLRKVESWVNQGTVVLITKRGKPVMHISKPEGAESRRQPVDYQQIRKEVSQERKLSKQSVQGMWEMLRGERAL